MNYGKSKQLIEVRKQLLNLLSNGESIKDAEKKLFIACAYHHLDRLRVLNKAKNNMHLLSMFVRETNHDKMEINLDG